jgi:hypothetical protein
VNCFQVVRSVLDTLYAQIETVHGGNTDDILTKEIVSLSGKMGNLYLRNDIDYSKPETRLAYIYSYTPCHADIIYQLLKKEGALQKVFDTDLLTVSCLGGGPGSEFVGLLKYMTLLPVRTRKLICLLCDKERIWREAWYGVDSNLSVAFSTSTPFWDVDVTDTSDVSPQSGLFQADLFTLIYLVSELFSGIEDARDFFDLMVQSAKPSALFLLVENNDRRFYGWFDSFAAEAGLDCVTKREDYPFVMTWPGEQAKELERYNQKFERTPKLTASIAYRVYRKPE